MLARNIRLAIPFLLGWWLTGISWGQDLSSKDSLLRLWQDTQPTDTVGMQALTVLIKEHYASSLPDSAYILSLQLYERALEADNAFYQAMAQTEAGQAMITQGRYEEANTYLQQGLELWEKLGDQAQISDSYNALGLIYKSLRKLDEAVAFLEKSISIKEQIGDSLGNAGPFLNLGAIAELRGDLVVSLNYNERALALSKDSGNDRLHGIACNNLANNYKALGDIVSAAEMYLEARAINEEIGDTWGVVNNLNNLSVLLIEDKQYEVAQGHLEEAQQISAASSLIQGEAMTYANLAFLWTRQKKWERGLEALQVAHQFKEENQLSAFFGPFLEQELGSVLVQLNRLNEAETYLKQGLEISRRMGNPQGILTQYMGLIQLYLKKEDWNRAFSYAQEGYQRATDLGNLLIQSQLARELVAIHKHFGRSDEALKMYEVHEALRDSLYNEENTRSLMNQELRYTYEQQAYQDSVDNAMVLAQKEEENLRRKTISYFLLAGLVMLLVFGWVLWNRFRLTRQQKQIIEAEKSKLDASNAQLNIANDKLKELDQFKSRFFTNISHEFRTPLTVIGGMIDQVHTNPQKWLETGSRLIKNNVNNLLHLINQILDLRKLESGNLRLDLIQDEVITFLRTHTESLRSMAESKKVELTFHADMSAQLMDFDSDKLLLVQTNLISNAIKFTPEGGQVEVRVSKPAPQHLLLEVKDTGIGIPEAQIPLIFDRFYQADHEQARVGEGTGIGLSLTRELVQLMEGQIQVASTLGAGSVFQVSLPITQKAPLRQAKDISPIVPVLIPEQPVIKEQPAPTPDGQQPTLLIIEDNPDVVTYIAACLEDAYRLFTARDGEEGIAAALEHVPDLIISDVMMPRKNGYEVTHALKSDERTSHIPIVLLTAKADRDSRLEGLGQGADAYLTKPFDQAELYIRLEQLLRLRQRLQARYSEAPRALPAREEAFKLEDAFIQKVKAVVLSRLDDGSYRPDDLIKDLGVSRTQMYNKIKALTGKSPSLFVRAVRIEKAKELLGQPDLQIAEIGYAVGFNEPQYFSRVFAKETGSSPSAYREQLSR